MLSKMHHRLLKQTEPSSMDESDRPLTSLSETNYSAPFVNSFTAGFSNIPSVYVDKEGNRETIYSVSPSDEWPIEPATLPANLHRTESWFKVLWDCLMIVLSALLLVKAALVIQAWRVDRDHVGVEIDQVSSFTLVLIRLNSQMVTIFTVIFTAIISTTLQRYALYKAQQGASVAQLEQLQGSGSPLSAIKLMWMLKSVTMTSAMLALVWSFYYLGSQANTLEYRFEQSAPFQDWNAVIPLNTDEGSNSVFLLSTDDLPTWQASAVGANAAAAEFHYNFTTFLSPGADVWGYALTPDLNILSNPSNALATYKPDANGWYDVSKQSQTFDLGAYTGMIGWPYSILLQPTITMFAPSTHWLGDVGYASTYLHIDCSLPMVRPDDHFPSTMFSNQTMSLRMVNNTSGAPTDQHGYPQSSFEFWLRPVPGLLMPLPNTSVTVCSLSHQTVDLRVSCQVSGCYPQTMRWTNGTNASAATSFHTPFSNDALASLFFDTFIQNYDNGSVNGFKPVALGSIGRYLELSSQPGHANASQNGTMLLPVLDRLFTMYFNTFFSASQMINSGVAFNPSSFREVVFHGAIYQPQYVISWAWITMDLISCFILFAAAVSSFVLRVKTMAPDILSSVSSLVRDSPHSGLPNNGTAMSGIQRTLMMKKVKVQLGDVSAHGDETGRIALRRVEPEQGKIKTLNPWTKYH